LDIDHHGGCDVDGEKIQCNGYPDDQPQVRETVLVFIAGEVIKLIIVLD
jgi:hypothetical protein